jgi:hypothetical protein
MCAVFAFDGKVGDILIVFRFVQAEEEDAARLEIALDIVDNIADVDVAASCYAAVDYVFLMGYVHIKSWNLI